MEAPRQGAAAAVAEPEVQADVSVANVNTTDTKCSVMVTMTHPQQVRVSLSLCHYRCERSIGQTTLFGCNYGAQVVCLTRRINISTSVYFVYMNALLTVHTLQRNSAYNQIFLFFIYLHWLLTKIRSSRHFYILGAITVHTPRCYIEFLDAGADRVQQHCQEEKRKKVSI